MPTRNVNLTAEQDAFIDTLVKSGYLGLPHSKSTADTVYLKLTVMTNNLWFLFHGRMPRMYVIEFLPPKLYIAFPQKQSGKKQLEVD